MMEVNTIPARLWRLRPWNSNRLMRGSDRLEAWAVLASAAILLFLVPIFAAIGTATYTRLTDQARTERSTHSEVQAVLLEDANSEAVSTMAGTAAGQGHARARWQVRGIDHSDTITVGPGAKAAQTISIWVDGSGTPVDSPRTGAENAATAIDDSIALWVTAAVVCTGLNLGLHSLHTKLRLAQWDSEWRGFGSSPGWSVR